MTDTVLITDKDGEYTYVCPNVHFIFGYTADEIRERGTIENLLGEELFDREELDEIGVDIETGLELSRVAERSMDVADAEPVGPGLPQLTVTGAAVYEADRLIEGKEVMQQEVVDAVEATVIESGYRFCGI